MNIDHLAMWVNDLEGMRNFYESQFGAKASAKYHNPTTDFSSYFLSFTAGARLEIMQKPNIATKGESNNEHLGLIHFAISVGSKGKVDSFTEKFRNDGLRIIGEPRTTGDGYYESIVLDPEGNRIEITV